MATSTLKHKLRKPAPADQVSVTADLSDNFEKIDTGLPNLVCTSGTRPASPYTGQEIFETDTGLRQIWTGADWLPYTFNDSSISFDGPVLYGIGFKNKFINSDFGVDQRYVLGSSVTSGFIRDRWLCSSGTGGTYNYSVLSTRLSLDDSFRSIQQVRVAAPAGGNVSLSQRIEDVASLSGKKITVSVWLQAAVSACDVRVRAVQYFGPAGSSAVTVTTPYQTIPVASDYVRYYFTLDIPSIIGKTLDGDDHYLEINFDRNLSGNTGLIMKYAMPQVEIGPQASNYERKPHGLDLELCRRYYYEYCTYLTSQSPIAMAQCISATNALATIPFIGRMRSDVLSPQWSAPGDFYVTNSTGTGLSPTNISISNGLRVGSFRLNMTVGGGLTAGNASMFLQANSNARLYIDSEL